MNEDKQIAATTGGAIGISAIASFIGLCCIGPWAVVLFGVSGARRRQLPHTLRYFDKGELLAIDRFQNIDISTAPQ